MKRAAVLLALVAAALPATAAQWRGTVTVAGVVHEPGAYHPYTTTISLRLREADRVAINGGFRIPLMNDGSSIDVEHSLHQLDGSLVCSGTGEEILDAGTMGYLETKAGETTYHVAIPRAFGAFACGQNRRNLANRFVIIGRGDYEAVRIESEDQTVRELEDNGTSMRGAYESKKPRYEIRYEYDVSWSVVRE